MTCLSNIQNISSTSVFGDASAMVIVMGIFYTQKKPVMEFWLFLFSIEKLLKKMVVLKSLNSFQIKCSISISFSANKPSTEFSVL
jgi:hypothetical protein